MTKNQIFFALHHCMEGRKRSPMLCVMSAVPHPPRPLCSACQRPLRGCICRWVTPTDNLTDVLLLQHPLETGNAKNSLRLLQLSLARRRLMVGEAFVPDDLERMLCGTGPSAAGATPLLLYPQTPGIPAAPAPEIDPARPLRLVVLDATWRKSRKMLALNPLLQRLPRLALDAPPPSRYLIRKAHRADQVSTLEAVCHALSRLEGDSDRYLPLLAAFDGFVAQQLDCRDAAKRSAQMDAPG
jgi:DTW domain-containing protein YfiP